MSPRCHRRHERRSGGRAQSSESEVPAIMASNRHRRRLLAGACVLMGAVLPAAVAGPAAARAIAKADRQAPTRPTGMAVASSDSTIRVTWTRASDNRGVTGYAVYRDGTRVAKVGSTVYAVKRTSCTRSVYTVSAYDKAGNLSARSAPVRPKACTPPPSDALDPPSVDPTPPASDSGAADDDPTLASPTRAPATRAPRIPARPTRTRRRRPRRPRRPRPRRPTPPRRRSRATCTRRQRRRAASRWPGTPRPTPSRYRLYGSA